jgi:hypothetical protein
MQFGIIVTMGQCTEENQDMVVTFTSQTNATKTKAVMPVFPGLTTAALNTKGINRVTLFSAERRMGIILG